MLQKQMTIEVHWWYGVKAVCSSGVLGGVEVIWDKCSLF